MTKKMQEALQLQEKLGRLVLRERELLNEVLDLIILADTSRFFLELGHASLFAWLTVHFKYSESAAKRRIDAARLKNSVPSIDEKIESGLINLSTVSKAQSAIRAEEIRTCTKMTESQKLQVVEKIEGKTSLETEKILMAEFPDARIFSREKVRMVSATEVNISVILTQAEFETFKRAQELLSHSVPNGSPGKIIAALSKEFVKRNDPLVKADRRKQSKISVDVVNSSDIKKSVDPVTANENSDSSSPMRKSRHIPDSIRSAVIKRDQDECQSRDPLSGQKCGSRYRVEIDHIKPWALGGEHAIENLQCLCVQHNRHRATQTFGPRKMRA